MKTKFTLLAIFVALCVFTITVNAQNLTITFDATAAGDSCQPIGASKMYMHSGAGTSGPTAAWEAVVGNWGLDDGVGQMTNAGTDMWEITIDLFNYYGLDPQNDVIYGIALNFRNGDASLEGKDDACSDFFIRSINLGTPTVENSDGSTATAITATINTGIDEKSPIGTINSYPNPFSGATTISYSLNQYADDLNVSVYNILGQEVATIFSGAQVAGTHNISWDGTNNAGEVLESGVYFFTVNNGALRLTEKLMLTR